VTARRTILLDGGMGRQLERMGAPFRQPEWSALALMEAPDTVRQAHAQFIDAGAEVITTNSYALVPFHIGEARFAAEGRRLADLAGRMARQAADAAGRHVRVAGSLPPLFGSYRPDLFDPARAPAILKVLIAGLAPHVDLWLAETQGSIREAEAASRMALAASPKPLWISYTLEDDTDDPASPRLRSGEPVAKAVEAALALGAEAVLFNCSQPEVMAAAIAAAHAIVQTSGSDARIGVYANAFPPQSKNAQANGALSRLRGDLDPASYLAFVAAWTGAGASIVGGCCGIGPEHIAAIRADLERSSRAG
jgi:S-methylmethionine-dependent homocysteine/selenocysteine methylase